MEASTLLRILFPIAVIQIVGRAVPGPNHLTIITASVTAGRLAGLKAAMGIASGSLTWTLIAVSGIEVVPSLYVSLRLLGAGYVIYLGVNAFRAGRRGGMFRLDANVRSPATNAPIRTAYFVMMTNPKAVLFFGSILTAFILPASPGWLMIIIAFQVGLLGAILNAFAAIFFSSAVFMRWLQAAGIWMSVVFEILFSALYALQPSIPHLTRSSLHRCLQRHGISRLPDMDGDKPKRQKFKRYPIGYFHIDIAELRTADGKLFLFVAIDRTSKFTVARLVEKANRKTAWEFLEHPLEAVPYRIHTI